MSKKPLFKAWGARRATQSRPRKRVQFNKRLRTGEVQESVENHYGVQLVRDRKCGDCAECCTQLPVDSINKPAMTPCSRLNEDGTGCGKYHARFNICKRFQCGWLFGFGEEEDRPDKSGCLVTDAYPKEMDGRPDIVTIQMKADEQREHAEKIAQQYQAAGVAVALVYYEKKGEGE